MPRHNLTARFIDSIKPPAEGRTEYWDASTPGFGLRVAPSGRKTWVVMYRAGGRLRRLSLGTYPALSLGSAREVAKDALRDVAKGKDPAGIKQSERKAETFRELGEEYLERHAKKKKRSWKKDDLALRRDLLPAFGHRKAKDIKRKDVLRLLDGIVERGAPIGANRTLEILRKIYNWGIAREIVETNPCHMVERPAPENRRERVLSDDEIRAVWTAFERETPGMRAHFKLRLLTAQRGGEVSHLRWSDIDMDAGWWTIPPEYSKNGLAHRVPLSPSALEIVREMEVGRNGSDWVFPSPSGRGPTTVLWKATGRIRESSDVEFVPHDLRRTAASRMTGDLGINRLVVSKVLNHVESGVTATYDRHSYDAEKRHALDAWGARLEEIVSGRKRVANVVPLATAGEAQ